MSRKSPKTISRRHMNIHVHDVIDILILMRKYFVNKIMYNNFNMKSGQYNSVFSLKNIIQNCQARPEHKVGEAVALDHI